MTNAAGTKKGDLRIERYFTSADKHPYDEVDWELRTAEVGGFVQHNVEFPKFWSQNSTNIVSQKYFRGKVGTAQRESSVRQLIDRVADKITNEGEAHGYFADAEERETFRNELKYILLHQYAAFNSPVWFNVGVAGERQQCSACFILSVQDTLKSILSWYVNEGEIFKLGSGAGINLSPLRGEGESLSTGGQSSGPVTFMRAADANAGTIRSGGKTRRAAKMVVLDVDHPDIEDFIWIKAREQEKLRFIQTAAKELKYDFPLGFDGEGDRNMAETTSYQNANNSVRVTDEFMQAVVDDQDFDLVARTTGEPTKTVKARELFRQLAQAAWRCADPGIQFDTIINKWHTAPVTGRINASNPCSEYMHVDDSSCNLASLNLLKFLRADDTFDVEAFEHVTRIIFTAQEITVAFGDFPTPEIERNTRALRQIGIGYANLGALLMALGLPYDSDEGRAWAAAITALETGISYEQSTRLAERMGVFEFYPENAEAMQTVLSMHRAAARGLTEVSGEGALIKAAKRSWNDAVKNCAANGIRNAQASVLAPTGTISFLMDCDTTGIEPDLALRKTKKLVGGGVMTIVNQTVPRALAKLGYTDSEIGAIVKHIEEHNSVMEAPHLKPEHRPVFACAMGDQPVHHMGHIKMMAACQPFISGAISKTVNLPEWATVEEIEETYLEAWKLGLKAIAVYRDNCTVLQPLQVETKKAPTADDQPEQSKPFVTSLLGDGLLRGERKKPPKRAQSFSEEFQVGPIGGFITVRLYEDGRPGGIFVEVAQAGSALNGMLKSFSTMLSLAIQYGTPLDVIVSKLARTDFEPKGFTDDPHIRQARSIVDYIARWLAKEYLDPSTHEALGITTPESRLEPAGAEGDPAAEDELAAEFVEKVEVHSDVRPAQVFERPKDVVTMTSAGQFCTDCGSANLQWAGKCMVCQDCGTSTGCG